MFLSKVGFSIPYPPLNTSDHYHNKSTNLGNDGYVAFQVEGDPAPTVEWFKVNIFLNTYRLLSKNFTIVKIIEDYYCYFNCRDSKTSTLSLGINFSLMGPGTISF